jgi:hypothetical protein
MSPEVVPRDGPGDVERVRRTMDFLYQGSDSGGKAASLAKLTTERHKDNSPGLRQLVKGIHRGEVYSRQVIGT